jgi:phosphatidate cytidylyltransferase
MIKLIQRLLIFFIGVPAVVGLIVFLPQMNHLALNVVLILLSAVSGIEFAMMLNKKGFFVRRPEAAILGSLSPIALTLTVSFGFNPQITNSLFIMGAAWLLVSNIFYSKDAFAGVLNRLAAGFLVMIYPGLFLSWIIRMSRLEYSGPVIAVFILTVMANDSLAWTAGVLFGRGNRGFLKVSPNKSLAGYIGGLSASIAVCIGGIYFLPGAFKPGRIPGLPAGILMGIICGIAVVLGDLAESAIKRSCDVKDSGFIIPGRGGAMDSLDSIALTAPVFYVLYRFFF